MTKTSIRALLFIALAALAACGDNREAARDLNSANQDQRDMLPVDFNSSLYAFNSTAQLTPVNPDDGNVMAHVTIPKGTIATRIETKSGFIHLGFDTEENSGLPSDLWFADTPELEAMISPASELDKQYYCYRYVKLYLLHMGLVKTYLPGSYAAEAFHILPEYGFHITGHSPTEAHIGEVCIYSGGPQGYGHIEVRRSAGWWYGYGFISHPIRNRHFMGCFVKA